MRARPEGEHTDQPFYGCRHAPEVEAFQQDLGIGIAAKAGTNRFQLAPQFAEIIGLAIIDDDESAARRDHRLAAGFGDIDDRQASEGECNSRLIIAPDAVTVRAAMHHCPGHGQRFAFHRAAA